MSDLDNGPNQSLMRSSRTHWPRSMSMAEKNVINVHMEIIGSDGIHVGIVDKVEGDRIKLTKAGSDDGRHHYVPTAMVQDIRGNTVTLTATAEAATAAGEQA